MKLHLYNYRGRPSIFNFGGCTHSESIEEIIPWVLVLLEQLEVLEDLLLDGDLVVVANRVLTEEIELHHILFTIHLFMEGYTIINIKYFNIMYTCGSMFFINLKVCFFKSI